MKTLLAVFAVVWLVPGAEAQVGAAPAGDMAKAFTAGEALAFSIASTFAAALRVGRPDGGASERAQSAGYALRAAWRNESGLLGWSDGSAGGPAPAMSDTLLYLIPNGGEAARRVFCVRGDGVLAFTENTAGTAMRDGREAEPDDALGEGGKGAMRDFPRTPTRGRDGNFWLPGDLVKQVPLRLFVVDEGGEPLAGVEVATVPAHGEPGLEVALPAGQARTLLEGDAVITGVPARGLAFAVTLEGCTVRLADRALALQGGSARLTVPRAALVAARVNHNESAAIATLKNISSAQAQCQASGVIDVNGNGAGEYGTFAELAGRDVVRGGKARMAPPVLSTAFSRIENGVVQRSGYCFRIFLPGKDGVAVAERANGGPDAAAIDSKQAETLWCVYAWPLEAGVTGKRAFSIDHNGDVLSCPNADGRYTGPAKAPAPDAARRADSDGTLQAPPAANQPARDGQAWGVIG